MPHPPQLSGSLAGFTQRAPQQSREYPHAASHPPLLPASPVPDSPLPASIAPLLLPLPELPLPEPLPPDPLALPEPPLPELPDALLADPLLLALLPPGPPLLRPPLDEAAPDPLALDPRPPEPPPLALLVVERSFRASTLAPSVEASSPRLATNEVPPQCEAAVTPRKPSGNQPIRRMILTSA